MALHVRAEHEFAVPPLALPDPKHLADVQALSQFEAVALFIAACPGGTALLRGHHCQRSSHRRDLHPPGWLTPGDRTGRRPRQSVTSPGATGPHLTAATAAHGGARDAPARQQTLRNTLAWSYELLTTEEQHLFRHLAAFIGGCTLEAVESLVRALGDPPSDVLDTLASLVDKSLLRQATDEGEEPHFAMLETIREYGLEMLATQGELERTQQAHAAYFLKLAEQAEPELEGPEQIRWLKRLER